MTDHPQEHESLDAFVVKVEESAVDVMRETLKDARRCVEEAMSGNRTLRHKFAIGSTERSRMNHISDRLDVASSKLHEATKYPAYTQAQRDAYAAEAVKQERERIMTMLDSMAQEASRKADQYAEVGLDRLQAAYHRDSLSYYEVYDLIKILKDQP